MEDLGRIVLRTGPVQDPGSRFWPGHWVLTESPDRPGQFFFSNQNYVVLVKKQKKIKVNGFVTGSWSGFTGSTRRVSQVTPDFFFPCFFFNPARFQPWIDRVLDQPAKRIRFQNYTWRPQIYCSPELFVLVLYQSIRCTLLLFYVIVNF
jgi:hypothetical protein